MCEFRLDTCVEESFDPVDDVFAKPPLVELLMTQSSVVEVVSPFLLEPSFVIAAKVFERTFALCLRSFSNDIIPVTLKCYCQHKFSST